MWNQQLNQVTLDPTGTSLTEKSNRIEWYLPDFSLLTQDNLQGKVKLNFAYAAMGNPSLEVPIVYLYLVGYPEFLVVYTINNNT